MRQKEQNVKYFQAFYGHMLQYGVYFMGIYARPIWLKKRNKSRSYFIFSKDECDS